MTLLFWLIVMTQDISGVYFNEDNEKLVVITPTLRGAYRATWYYYGGPWVDTWWLKQRGDLYITSTLTRNGLFSFKEHYWKDGGEKGIRGVGCFWQRNRCALGTRIGTVGALRRTPN